MATEPELLKAVLQAPDEDGRRLEYADWCDARNDPPPDPRGEFIRLQLDLAALGNNGPAPLRADLTHRLTTLGTAHHAQWAGRAGAVAQRYQFDRGFVELVSLSAAAFVASSAEIFAAAPVRHLDITSLGPAADALLASPALARIRSLSMDDTGLEDRHIEKLAGSPHARSLRWLSVRSNRLGFDAARALAASPHTRALQFVNFNGNPLEPVAHYALDDDNVLGEWMPPEATLLESWHGHIPWLHRQAEKVRDLIPDRFRI